MKRKSLLAASAILAVLAGVANVHANGGGGGSGGGSDGATNFGGPGAHGFFGGPGGGGVIGRALIAAPEPSGSTVLPGGTFMRLDGFKASRDVVVDTPQYGTFKGKHIKTTFNPATGITSVWMRNGDGTRTGIHTDSRGNQMVSEHRR